MSIFGKLDAQSIPSNPYFIEKGDYDAEVTKGEFRTKQDGTRQLFIEYTITEENSAYLDSRASQFFNLPDPELTQEAFNMMPADDQKKLRQQISAMKRTLCGNDANPSQKGLGVDADDLNDESWDPGSLVGTKVRIGISNYGATNEGVNVRWVNLAE